MSGKSTRRNERALAMHELYADGATLQEVGRKYGLTKERVRQIFQEADLPTMLLTDRRRRSHQRRADEIVESFRELRDQRAVAEALSMPKTAVDEILRQRLPAAELRKPQRYMKRYSNEELISMLREASQALGVVLTSDGFEGYGRDRALGDGRRWPTGQVLALRFGGWRKALQAAGLPANPSSPIAGKIVFDEPQCIDALRHVARQLGKVPTAAGYEEFARKANGALPSQTTIRNRFGSWYGALAEAGL